MDVAPGQAPLGPALVVDRGEDVRIGVEVADLEEDALGAADSDQEVVYQHNPGLVTRPRSKTHNLRCRHQGKDRNIVLSIEHTDTLAAMDQSPRRRARAIVLLVVAAAALAPAAAFAQSAGDEQYADPIVEGDGGDGGEEAAPPPAAPRDDTGSAPAAPSTGSGAVADAAAGTARPAATLPRTGVDAALLAAAGLALLAAGAALRPKLSPH
jgi:hypothetical protein